MVVAQGLLLGRQARVGVLEPQQPAARLRCRVARRAAVLHPVCGAAGPFRHGGQRRLLSTCEDSPHYRSAPLLLFAWLILINHAHRWSPQKTLDVRFSARFLLTERSGKLLLSAATIFFGYHCKSDRCSALPQPL